MLFFSPKNIDVYLVLPKLLRLDSTEVNVVSDEFSGDDDVHDDDVAGEDSDWDESDDCDGQDFGDLMVSRLDGQVASPYNNFSTSKP